MAVTIRPIRFKVTQEWEQKTRIGRYGTYFDRDFFISKKAFGFGLGNLNFNVKFKTDRSNDPYVIVETESKETFIDFRILVEYYTGGKIGCFTSNPKKDLLYKSQKVEVSLSFLTSIKKLSQRNRGYFWVLLDYF